MCVLVGLCKHVCTDACTKMKIEMKLRIKMRMICFIVAARSSGFAAQSKNTKLSSVASAGSRENVGCAATRKESGLD